MSSFIESSSFNNHFFCKKTGLSFSRQTHISSKICYSRIFFELLDIMKNLYIILIIKNFVNNNFDQKIIYLISFWRIDNRHCEMGYQQFQNFLNLLKITHHIGANRHIYDKICSNCIRFQQQKNSCMNQSDRLKNI